MPCKAGYAGLHLAPPLLHLFLDSSQGTRRNSQRLQVRLDKRVDPGEVLHILAVAARHSRNMPAPSRRASFGSHFLNPDLDDEGKTDYLRWFSHPPYPLHRWLALLNWQILGAS